MTGSAAATKEYRREQDNRGGLPEYLEIVFPPDQQYRGRVSVEYIPEAGGKPRQLFYCYTDELPAKLEEMERRPYLNYYTTINPLKGKRRGNSNILRLQNIVIDIDCHDETTSDKRREWLTESFAQFLEYKGLPLPCNVITRTGRGLQLLWALDPVSYKMRRAYNLMTSILCADVEKILQEWCTFYRIDPQEFKIDQNASGNAAGLFRLPGTRNTKTNPAKMAIAQRIHSKRININAEIGRRAADLLNDKRGKEGEKWDAILQFPTQDARTAAARAAVIFNLQAMRTAAGNPVRIGERNNWVLILYCVLVSAGVSHEAAMQRVETLNRLFVEPMTPAEIETSLSTAKVKRYRLPNQYIIETLHITPEEQNALRFYKGGSHLNNTREQEAQAARDEKARRDALILERYDNGETVPQIAAAAGCTAPTVRSVLQRVGRPSRSETLRGRIRILYQQGKTPAEIADATGAHLATVYRHIKAAREAGEIWATDGANNPAGEFIKARAKTATEAKTGPQDPQPMKRAAHEAGQDPNRATTAAAEIWPESAGNNSAGVFTQQQAETATEATGAAEAGNIKSGINAEGGAVPGIVAHVFAKRKKSPYYVFGTVIDKQYSISKSIGDPEKKPETLEDLREKIEAQRPVLTAEEAERQRQLIKRIRRNHAEQIRQGIKALPLPGPARIDPEKLRE